MTLQRVRLIGGELQGKLMWVEPGAASLNIHIGGQRPGVTRTLHYRRSGTVLRFVGETGSGPEELGGSSR